MDRGNGFLAVRVALASGVSAAFILWAAGPHEEDAPPRVSGPEDLRRELWRAQSHALPSEEAAVFVDAGEFVYTGTGKDAPALAEGLLPAAGGDGGERWPVTLFEDALTRETVFLDAGGGEAFRMAPPPGYDPAWLLEAVFLEGTGIPEWAGADAYDPARVLMTAWLLPATNHFGPPTHTPGRTPVAAARRGAPPPETSGVQTVPAAPLSATAQEDGADMAPAPQPPVTKFSVFGGGPGQTYHADASRPDDSGDGLSWATAKKTIQAAVDLAADGDTVLVTNGVYNTGTRLTPGGLFMNRLVVTNAVTVRSVGGSAATVIEGSGAGAFDTADAVRCVCLGAGVLEGFTLRGGAAVTHWTSTDERDKSGGCVSMYEAAEGTEVRNCIITGGTAYDGGGAYRGRLVNCVLYGNEAYWGGGAYRSVLLNCTLAGNNAWCEGGGAFVCGITNSIAYGNTGYYGGGTDNHHDSQVGYSCGDPLPPGDGNISLDPQFADPANDDYRLLGFSPCVDSGDNLSVTAGTDITGNARIQGNVVDMGAHESPPSGDLDGDGMSDVWEVSHGFDPLTTQTDGVHGPDDDPDNDGAPNLLESIHGTDPANRHSDGDTLTDGEEIFARVVEWGNPYSATNGVTRPAQLGEVVAVSAGMTHSVVLKRDGYIACWGNNASGKCVPPDAISHSAVKAVSAGSNHSMAVVDDGSVVCWGASNYNQCTPPVGLSNVVAVAAGTYHSVALLADSNMVCWGQSTYGQCAVPGGLSGIIAVAAGTQHSMALRSDGTVSCWGSHPSLQYGITNVPSSATGVVAIASGSTHCAALRRDGTVICWGNTASGRCAVPAHLTNAVLVAAGANHTLAFTSDGRIVAWGLNTSGQARSFRPYGPVLAMDGGTTYSIALIGPATSPLQTDTDGDGMPDDWELSHGPDLLNPDDDIDGDGLSNAEEYTNHADPHKIDTDDDWITDGDEVLVYGTDPSSVDTDGDGWDDVEELFGRVVEWGAVYTGSSAVSRPDRLGHVTSVSAGYAHRVAVRSDGSAVCWGHNGNNRCVVPANATGLVEVAAGFSHNVGLRGDGSVVCWGYVGNNRCAVPSDLTNAVAVAAGWAHSLAARDDGTVSAWGQNASHQCDVPSNLTDVVAVSAGSDHSVALLRNGHVVCWGQTNYAQCAVPVALTNAISVHAGYYHTIALTSDGRAVCWGRNNYGQCSVPAGLTNIVSVGAGNHHSMACSADGRVVSWGLSTSGQCATQTFHAVAACLGGGDAFSMALVPGNTDPASNDNDSDGDGMSDGWEVSNGLDPFSGLSGSLAGWWRFREESGTNVVDLSGNGNDAFILFPEAVSRSSDAPVGQALHFSTNLVGGSGLLLWNKLGSAGEIANSEVGPDGTLAAGSFVPGPFGNAIELDMGQRFGCTFPAAPLKTPRGCMEFWARLSGFPAQMPWSGGKPVLVGCPTPEGSPDCIIFYFNANNGGGDGGLCVSSSFGHTGTGPYGSWTYSGAIGGGDVAEWHHYAVSWDKDGIPGLSGGTRKVAVFVDGNLNSAPGTLWDAETFFDVPDGYVFGLLSHQGITEGRVAFDNLKIWNYAKTDFSDRFDEGSGHIGGYNGGFVCVPGLSNAVLSSGFSAAAWVRAESYPPYAPVLTKTDDHDVWGDGFSLYHEEADSLSFYAGNWGEDTVAGGVSGTGVWRHVCGVYDGTNALLYIDGALRGTRTNVVGTVANGDPLWIGSVFKNDRWLWHGDIADVRFYTSALSASQVNGLLEFAADPDGDGVPNLQEYARGTDPNDPASRNRTLYADSGLGSGRYDGFSQTVLSVSRGPKATAQQAVDAALSGDAIELRGQASFPDTVLSPGDKRLILRPVGGVRF